MLKQHQFYVYHDGPSVFARMGAKAAVLAETCASPQAAYDRVQSVVNPLGKRHDDPAFEGRGFHHPAFQSAISANCEAFVKAAYAAITED